MKKNNKQYLVRKDIPLKGRLLKKGDLIDETDEVLKFLDVKNKEFFEIWAEAIYYDGEIILFKPSSSKKYFRCIVVQRTENLKYSIKEIDSNNMYTITDKTADIKKPNDFWFINSDGQIHSDYEERHGINVKGLEFKKKIGNYFTSLESAQSYRESLLNKN